MLHQIGKAAVAVSAAGLISVCGLVLTTTNTLADGNDSDLAQIGLNIIRDTGLTVYMRGKDPDLVGLGSFIVNAQADCNGCHGSNAAFEYQSTATTGNNPYFLPGFNYPVKYNQLYYLNGGQNFGPVGAGNSSGVFDSSMFGPGLGPDIYSRNLTPDHTGNPEGGNDFNTFKTIIRMGTDFDHLHPNCSSTVTTNCYNAVPSNQIDGNLLQVMPWPKLGNMTDRQLLAIWTYLSALPCNANSALSSDYSWLKNTCGTVPTVPGS